VESNWRWNVPEQGWADLWDGQIAGTGGGMVRAARLLEPVGPIEWLYQFDYPTKVGRLGYPVTLSGGVQALATFGAYTGSFPYGFEVEPDH